jgi:hypothetical protein
MTGDKTRPGFFLLAVASLCSMTLLSGCDSVRQVVGLDRRGPDEFAVESRAPLTIPPDFELRPPAPGASRPQEVSAAERARKAIDTAGPGEPGKQAAGGLRVPEGGLARADAPNAEQQPDQGLSNKLLGYGGEQGGAEKRETTTLKGVY